MPRRSVDFAPNTYYHIYNRGVRLQSLFIEPTNYEYIIRSLGRIGKTCGISIIAYCLLPNHYHLLVYQEKETAAGELPKRVFGGYSRAVNRRYGWEGTLYEGRFKAKTVKDQDFLRHLCRYIHANPVKHGFVDDLEAWPWSNYLEWVGKRERTAVNRPLVDAVFGSGKAYADFVADYLAGFAAAEALNYLREWEN